MADAAALLRAAGVGCVYLLHGTFVGDDTWGLIRPIGRYFPRAGDALRRAHKKLADALVGESGNYLDSLVADLERAFNADEGPPIAVQRFVWSSGNHHLARADAAVRLIDELSRIELPAGKRILCWGHSHGGNVLALLTHLVGGSPDELAPFFAAAGPFYRHPWSGRTDVPAWERVERLLLSSQRPVLPASLDVVTFGTPIRYGWHPSGYAKLLHFVNHRPKPGLPEHQAAPPRTLGDVVQGRNGDFMHQIGIAGSDFPPLFPFGRTWRAERRLRRLLQPEYSLFDLWPRLQYGLRAADAGTTLLVDYDEPVSWSLRNLTGHLLYTTRKWLPFHAAETARRLYTDGA